MRALLLVLAIMLASGGVQVAHADEGLTLHSKPPSNVKSSWCCYYQSARGVAQLGGIRQRSDNDNMKIR